MTPSDLATVFLEKAKQDLHVVQALSGDPETADEVIGFHAQQAAEKALKAVLVHASVQHRRTHDLAELLDIAHDHGLSLPPIAEDTKHLTPFAVEYRYDVFSEEEEPVDRDWALACAREIVEWAQAVVQDTAPARNELDQEE